MTTKLNFIHDAEYIETCGKKTVLELLSSLSGFIDRHDNAFHASSLRLNTKTFGRIIDLATLAEEISCLHSDLVESEKVFGFFWKTALYLQERILAAQERMESLRAQKKEQEELRLKFEVAARGPTLPREIIDIVLTHVPTKNELSWEGKSHVYVDGLLPFTLYNPPVLLPYYEECFKSEWTLGVIAEQKLRRSVLDDTSLADHIKLRSNQDEYLTTYDVSDLRPLTNNPHLWNKLDIYPRRFVMEDFIDWYSPSFPFLEELDICADSVVSSGVVFPLDGRRLKIVCISFRMLPDFFNTGCLKSITSLTLYWFDSSLFVDHSAFIEGLYDFVLMIGQLSSLYELAVWSIDCDRIDLESLPRIKSTLQSLEVGFRPDDSAFVAAFLNLFAGCHIDTIHIDGRFLREAEVLFGDVQRVCVKNSIPDILFERNVNGNLTFPRLERLEVIFYANSSQNNINIPQLQDILLQSVRARSEDAAACRIHKLYMPRQMATSTMFQEEIEGYVQSLVLTERQTLVGHLECISMSFRDVEDINMVTSTGLGNQKLTPLNDPAT